MVELSKDERGELLKIFKEESDEYITNIGKLITGLSKEPGNEIFINDLLRDVHSFKGSAGMLGFKKMQNLIHSMEDVLKDISEKRLHPDRNVIDILFENLDAITQLRDSRVNDKEIKIDLDKVKSRISALKNGRKVAQKFVPDMDDKKRGKSVQSLFEDIDEQRPLTEEEVTRYQKVKSAIDDLSNDFDEALSDHEKKAAKGYSGIIKTMPKLQISDTMRVSSEAIDHIISHVERLLQDDSANQEELAQLKDELLELRCVRFSKLLDLLPRLIRQLSGTLGKEVELVSDGADLKIGKEVLEELKDPLVHLIRNAIDHGIELPRERQILGKGRVAKITITVKKEDEDLIVEIMDDGRGIDLGDLKKSIVRKGLASENQVETMNTSQMLEFLFKPGFTTSRKVGLISGRGIGLDVVKNNIEKIRGTIKVETKPEKGAKFILRFPSSF